MGQINFFLAKLGEFRSSQDKIKQIKVKVSLKSKSAQFSSIQAEPEMNMWIINHHQPYRTSSQFSQI